jgi:peptidoglycan/LPS O-acetylase OafA/YrhL
MLGLAGAGLLAHSSNLIFFYLGLFLMGIVLFQRTLGFVGNFEFCIVTILLILEINFKLGIPHVLAGMFTLISMLFFTLRSKWLSRLGSISYALYLVHVPIGHFGFRLGHLIGVGVTLSFVIALAASIIAAQLLYMIIERPSQRLSSSIRYRQKEFIEPSSNFKPVPEAL